LHGLTVQSIYARCTALQAPHIKARHHGPYGQAIG
jgi:hypothetical protein